MARKKVSRALLRLPGASALRASDHKQERLLEILRDLASSNQASETQPFYAVRQIAEHFHVPLSVVARVYARLEEEGLVSRIRGSRTLLQGKESGRQITVRGLIGLPASLSCLITMQDYRMFFRRTRRELRTRGFIAEMVYFENRELRTGELSERLGVYKVDTVVWFLPELAAGEEALRLRDKGIRVIGVSDGGVPGFACAYEIRREGAMKIILAAWRSGKAIATATVVSVRGRRSAADEERPQEWTEEAGLDYEVVILGEGEVEPVLRSLLERKACGIILQSCAASLCAFRLPELFKDLLASHPHRAGGWACRHPLCKAATGARRSGFC